MVVCHAWCRTEASLALEMTQPTQSGRLLLAATTGQRPCDCVRALEAIELFPGRVYCHSARRFVSAQWSMPWWHAAHTRPTGPIMFSERHRKYCNYWLDPWTRGGTRLKRHRCFNVGPASLTPTQHWNSAVLWSQGCYMRPVRIIYISVV